MPLTLRTGARTNLPPAPAAVSRHARRLASAAKSVSQLEPKISTPRGPRQSLNSPESLQPKTDGILVQGAQIGDHAAFEELVHRYDQAVLRLALHLSGSESEAQDIYQEAFLKAYRNIRNFRFECSFYTWMYRIVTNLCLDHLRNRRIRREDQPVAVTASGAEYDLLSLVPDSRPGGNPERALLAAELRTRIEHALRKLTSRERLVFELKHYQGLRLRAVGDILNTTEETVKSTLFRATRKLRAILTDTR